MGLRGRLSAVHVGVLVVLLAVLGAYLFAGARQTLEDARLDRLSAAASAIRSGLDAEEVDDTRLADAAAGAADPGLAVLLVDGGSVVARAGWPVSLPPGWVTSRPIAGATTTGFSDTDGVRLAWASLSLAPTSAGYLVVLGDTADVDATLGEVGAALLLGLVAASVLGGIAIWWVTGRALAPVRRLSDAAGRLAAGDVTARVPVAPGNDELAHVGRAFNSMAARMEELLERQRAFVADASHELRTPLSALVGSLDVLERADPDDAARLRASMQTQLRRLARMADDLLLLTRLDATSAGGLDRRAVDLALVARDVVEEARHLPEAAGSEVRLIAEGPAPVHGDADALHRLLLNLVANALRHGGPPVEVSVAVEGRGVVATVRDSGPGIPPELLPHAFDRFRRGQGAEGSGLGLAIARAIAEAHGGTIRAENRPGAVIELELPVGLAGGVQDHA